MILSFNSCRWGLEDCDGEDSLYLCCVPSVADDSVQTRSTRLLIRSVHLTALVRSSTPACKAQRRAIGQLLSDSDSQQAFC